MFGGLTKTSSRIAIAAALGMVLGGYALTSPAKAAGGISVVTAARISRSG